MCSPWSSSWPCSSRVSSTSRTPLRLPSPALHAFKAGPVEFSALDASAENIKDVVAAVEKVKTETSDSVAQLKKFVGLTVATSGAESRQLRDELRRVTERLDRGGNEP